MDQNRVGDRGGNLSLSKAGLRQAQITAHYNEIQIQNNVYYTVDGIFDAQAPRDNINALAFTGNTQIPACNAALFALWVAAGNTLTVTRGPNVDATTLTGTGRTGKDVLKYPDVQANNALVGLIKVVVGTGASFTFGTTNFNATNVTTTFYDCSAMPTIPLTS